jgi:hypothetical protein
MLMRLKKSFDDEVADMLLEFDESLKDLAHIDKSKCACRCDEAKKEQDKSVTKPEYKPKKFIVATVEGAEAVLGEELQCTLGNLTIYDKDDNVVAIFPQGHWKRVMKATL